MLRAPESTKDRTVTHQLATDWTAILTADKLSSLISYYALPHHSRYILVTRRVKILVEGLAALVRKFSTKYADSYPACHVNIIPNTFEASCAQRLTVMHFGLSCANAAGKRSGRVYRGQFFIKGISHGWSSCLSMDF